MMSSIQQRVWTSTHRAVAVGASPTDDDAIEDLELDDPTIDEAELPHLDTEDPELVGHEPGYEDLLDRGWLERSADDDLEDDRAALEGIGLTIELDGPEEDDENAEVVDLDIGSLLTPLQGEGSVFDLDPALGHERGELGLGILGDMFLPDEDEAGQDDREVGDDERFPVFEEGSEIAHRPSLDDDDLGHTEELVGEPEVRAGVLQM